MSLGVHGGKKEGRSSVGGEQRLEFIEFRLFCEGHVNRGDLMEAFGVSVNQASTGLSRYIGMAPNNMVYDKSARTYIRRSAFDALFLKPDASRYLSQLRSVADGILDRADAWIGQSPSYDSAPTPVRGLNAKTLRSVIAAIRRSEALEVKYQSISRPEPLWRWIAPHAIGFDGFCWHARALCLTDQSFEDFPLSRIIETRGSKPSEAEPEADAGWNEQVTLEIGPHPELSNRQQEVIALDHGMRRGRTKIPCARRFFTMRSSGWGWIPTPRRGSRWISKSSLPNREVIDEANR